MGHIRTLTYHIHPSLDQCQVINQNLDSGVFLSFICLLFFIKLFFFYFNYKSLKVHWTNDLLYFGIYLFTFKISLILLIIFLNFYLFFTFEQRYFRYLSAVYFYCLD